MWILWFLFLINTGRKPLPFYRARRDTQKSEKQDCNPTSQPVLPFIAQTSHPFFQYFCWTSSLLSQLHTLALVFFTRRIILHKIEDIFIFTHWYMFLSIQPEKLFPPKWYWKGSHIKLSVVLIWILSPAFFRDSPSRCYILFNQWRTVMLSELERGRGWYQEQPWSAWKKENAMCRANMNNFSCLIFLSDQIPHNKWKIIFLKMQLLLTGKQNALEEQEGSHSQPDSA